MLSGRRAAGLSCANRGMAANRPSGGVIADVGGLESFRLRLAFAT